MEWFYGRCYCLCGRWNSLWVNCLYYFIYFILNSEMLNRASSHMWGIWYLPIFLFRDGLLTLMYIDSFIFLMRFWYSLPTILKFSSVVVWPLVLKWSYIGEGSFRCSLNLSPKCSWRLSYVIFIMFHPVTIVSVYNATFLCYMIFVFWCYWEVFDGPTPF